VLPFTTVICTRGWLPPPPKFNSEKPPLNENLEQSGVGVIVGVRVFVGVGGIGVLVLVGGTGVSLGVGVSVDGSIPSPG
jgi:hypothetical protein